MNTLIARAVLAGACFGAWPLFLSRSGFSGSVASFLLLVATLALVAPFAYLNYKATSDTLLGTEWTMVVLAGIFSACGLLAFNSALAEAASRNVATLFVLTVLAQACVPVLWDIAQNRTITLAKALGFVFAGTGAVLLTRASS